jgi:hypothetical protein
MLILVLHSKVNGFLWLVQVGFLMECGCSITKKRGKFRVLKRQFSENFFNASVLFASNGHGLQVRASWGVHC